jgi:subtilisin family serine protease
VVIPAFSNHQPADTPVITAYACRFMITSAFANAAGTNTCGTVAKAGTSMATPVVAGNAAIVRQYFVEAW